MSDRVGRVAVLVVAVTCLLAVTGVASAATSDPRYDENGRIIETPFVPAEREPAAPREGRDRARAVGAAGRGVGRALSGGRSHEDGDLRRRDEGVEGQGVVRPKGRRPDRPRRRSTTMPAQVTEAWVGPQVAWTMARGYEGSFGRKINEPWIWWPLAAIFFVGLASLRRPLSMRNLDLVVLLSFAASWWFFNEGQIFTSVPLAYPPLVYLLGRMVWLGVRGRLAGAVAASVLAGLGARCGDRVHRRLPDRPESRGVERDRRRLRGRHRRAADRERGPEPLRQLPRARGSRVRPARSNGDVRDRMQTNGRCETANDRGDTYGPIAYIAYVPGYLAAGWSGKWDRLPAAHFTSLLFDGLTLIGLALVGWRFGGARLAATLHVRLGRVSVHDLRHRARTRTTRSCQRCSSGGFGSSTSAAARGLFVGLASWAKFAPVPSRAALGLVSGRAQAAARTRAVRSGRSWSPPCSGSGCCCSSRTRFTRPGSSGTGRSAGSSAATRRSLSGTGPGTRATRISTSSRRLSRSCCWSARSCSASFPAGSRRSSSPRSPRRS